MFDFDKNGKKLPSKQRLIKHILFGLIIGGATATKSILNNEDDPFEEHIYSIIHWFGFGIVAGTATFLFGPTYKRFKARLKAMFGFSD